MTYSQVLQSLPATGAELLEYDGTNRLSTSEERAIYERVKQLEKIGSIVVVQEAEIGANDSEPWFNKFLGARIVMGTGAMPALTPRQVRLELLDRGLLATVEGMVQQTGGAAQVEWDYAIEFKIDHQLVTQIASALEVDLVEFWESALER